MHNLSYDYINDYMYFIVRQAEDAGLVYCSGVNVSRFTPLTAGKHRLGQNIAMKGLQSLNIELRSFLLSHGWQPKTVRGGVCHDEKTRAADDVWNSETLQIDNSSDDFTGREVVMFAVKNFLRIVLPQCIPPNEIPTGLPEEMPDEFSDPAGLQRWLDSRCKS